MQPISSLYARKFSQLIFTLSLQVISEELFRNMGLALMTVFLVTLLVLANLGTCLLVFTCVGFTLVRITRYSFAHA